MMVTLFSHVLTLAVSKYTGLLHHITSPCGDEDTAKDFSGSLTTV